MNDETSGWGDLVAADKRTGQEVWRLDLPDRLFAPVGIDGDHLYLALGGQGSRNGLLMKLRRDDGTVVYNRVVKMPDHETIPIGPEETPVFYKNLVIIESGDFGDFSRIYAFDKETAEIEWTYRYEGAFRYALTVEDGVLYFATLSTDMFALNAADGMELWQNDVMRGSSTRGPVSIYDDLLFASSADSYLYCFQKRTGKMLLRKINHWEPFAYQDTLFVGGYTDPTGDTVDYFAAFKIKN